MAAGKASNRLTITTHWPGTLGSNMLRLGMKKAAKLLCASRRPRRRSASGLGERATRSPRLVVMSTLVASRAPIPSWAASNTRADPVP
jgi:hypothetical protein